MEKISVYIPCFNVERFIGECIEHLMQQTLAPDEILVINDGSVDNTVKIANQYPVRIIHHNGNQGLSVTRNTGVNNARNELVASIDADCLASKDWLAELVKLISTSNSAGVGGKLIEKNKDRVTDRWRAIHMRQHWWEDIKINPPFLFGNNNLFRKSILIESGLYNPKYRTNYEDVDICNRIREKGYNLIYNPQAIVYHLRRDSIYSLFNAYWRWTLFDKVEPLNMRSIFLKWWFNLGKMKYFMMQDLRYHKYDLLFYDILMVFYLSYFDWQHYKNYRMKNI